MTRNKLTERSKTAQPNQIVLRGEDRVFVLTGAGISAESGLATFRGAAGLWEGERVEDVASPRGWQRDPERVWRFYSLRRKAAVACQAQPRTFRPGGVGAQTGPALLPVHAECGQSA